MSKKILITGAGGFVGKNLYQYLVEKKYDVLGIGKTAKESVDKVVDISDPVALNEVLETWKPDQIVHLAALSNVEKCEVERGLAYAQNVKPVETLTTWANTYNKRIIFVSTDYVFDGEAPADGFTENDTERPLQYYGETKLQGEHIVSTLQQYVIVRPTVIYGWDRDGMNFFMQLYRNQRDKKTMNIPTDQVNNPTSVVDLCHLLEKIIQRDDVVGTFIATGNETFGRYDFAVQIAEHMGWDTHLLLPVSTQQLGQVAKRPLHNVTSNKKVVQESSFSFASLDQHVTEIREQMKKHI